MRTINRNILKIGEKVSTHTLMKRDAGKIWTVKQNGKIVEMVRQAKMLFDENEIIVRTDYGCLSIYKV